MLDLVWVGLLLIGVVACCGALAVVQVLVSSYPSFIRRWNATCI